MTVGYALDDLIKQGKVVADRPAGRISSANYSRNQEAHG